MKNVLAKIWFPFLLVAIAAVQSFGIDAGRSVGLKKLADSLGLSLAPDTLSVQDSIVSIKDSIAADTVAVDSIAIDTMTVDTAAVLILSARDTIVVPDSLKETDPFKYKY